MVAVVYGSDADFSVISHGMPNQNTLQYLQHQFNQLDPNLFLDQSFVQNAMSVYDQYNGDSAMQRARALLNQTNQWVDPNAVHMLHSIEEFQTADPVMQRWIMASPYIRELYHSDRIHGYAESYVDTEPGCIGEDHYDYRRVMDGILEYVEYEDDDDIAFKTTFYLDPLIEGDRELTDDEQLDILSMWDVLNNLIESQDEDPTDVFGGSL